MWNKLFGSGEPAVEIDPTDTVIPLHYFDDTLVFRSFLIYTLFAFDDVLDPEVLRESLGRLVQRDGWKKLGGRLRKNKQGKFEYHVPAAFTKERPPVAFTHEHFSEPAATHPVASKIPKASVNVPAIVGDPEELSGLLRVPGGPKGVNDYLTSNRPTLGLHVTTFADKTTIVLYWPHLAFDAMGKKAIIEGWLLAMQGRDDEIPTPIGFDKDPLGEFGCHPTEEHALADQRMPMSSTVAWALRNITGLAGAKEIRMVCIPRAFWEKLRVDVMVELGNEAKERGEAAPFVTEGDVLCAWWTRLCSCHLGAESNTTVSAGNAMSVRRALKDDLLPEGQPFVSNALIFPTLVLPASEVLTRPLSWLALQVRTSISEQGTRAQHEAYASLIRQFNPNYRTPVMFGDSGMYQLIFSNWQKAGMFDFDFSPARAATSTGSGSIHAKYIQCCQDPNFIEGWPISGKDEHGNYWIAGYRAKGLWGKLEMELERQLAEAKNK